MFEYQYPHPAVTTDSVIFTVRDSALQVLLIQRLHDPCKGRWAFPGGFINIDEDLDAAVRRELQEETGLSDIPLEQFYTFGSPDRDPRERVITVAYLALVRSEELAPIAADDAGAVGWFGLDNLPELAFDHGEVVQVARRCLLERIETSEIALAMMPEHFTLSDLQGVYEAIMGESLDAVAFRDWVLAQGWIEQTDPVSDAGL